MFAKKESMQDEPFWMDEPNPHAHSSAAFWEGRPRWMIDLFRIYVILVFSFIFFLVIFLAIKFPILWILVAVEALLISARLILPRTIETAQARALRIQQLAKDRTTADYLGSAIHTAGHPSLQVNQPVVLALKDSEIFIYGYGSPIPIDSFPVADIRAVDLVVMDDENIPHAGVIDNNAQALQITFNRRNVECLASFRRMYKVRPVEWYHAIQKARFEEKAA